MSCTVNVENVKHAIAVMRIATNLDMEDFQSTAPSAFVCNTISSLHSCGNTACFAGYLIIDPTFRKWAKDTYGEKIEFHPTCGCIELSDTSVICSDDWLARYLGISVRLARGLIYNDGELYSHYCSFTGFTPTNPVAFEDVKPKHVIEKLQAVLDGRLS